MLDGPGNATWKFKKVEFQCAAGLTSLSVKNDVFHLLTCKKQKTEA